MTILGLVSTFRLTISVDWFVPSDTITSNGITLGVLVFGIVIKGVGDVASDIQDIHHHCLQYHQVVWWIVLVL